MKKILTLGWPVVCGKRPSYSQMIQKLFGTALIGYWPLDEGSGTTAIDASASGVNLTYSGVTLRQPGIGDGKTCAYFDGAASYAVSTEHALESVASITEGTIMLWFKMDGADRWNLNVQCRLAEFDNMAGSAYYLGKGNPANILICSTTNRLVKPEATWMHAAFTWSATGNKLCGYYGGDLVDVPTAFTEFVANFARYLYLGRSGIAEIFHKGWIAHVVLLDRAATEAEMRMAAELPPVTAEVDYSASSAYITKIATLFGADLLGHWPLNESRGCIAHDISENVKTGTNSPYLTFNDPGIGDGLTCSRFYRPSVTFIDTYQNGGLVPGWNMDEGTIMAWGKMYDLADWSYDNQAYMFYISNQAGNKLGIGTFGAGGVGNRVGCYVSAEAVTNQNYVLVPHLDWFHLAFTWSKAANERKIYYNGAAVGSTLTCVGGYIDPFKIITFGKLQTSSYWNGWLAHAVMVNRPATAEEIADAASLE